MINKKIKIYYVIGPLGYGGAERLVIDLVKNLDKNIFLPKVFSIREKGILATELEKEGIEVIAVSKKNKLGFDTLVELIKRFKKDKPDIVHTHLFIGDTWGRVAALLAGVPIIVSTEHNVNLDEKFFKKKIKLILSWFTKKIFAVSDGVRKYSEETEGISSNKVKVIYNGVDIEKFKNNEFKFNNVAPIILTIGRLEFQKGQDSLIEAFAQVRKKFLTAKLLLVGNGSLEKVLKQQVKRLNLSGAVEFLGNSGQIPELLSHADIFVLPSMWEGLGIVLLEAMVSLKPVIASNIPAVDEIVKNEQNGLLFVVSNIDDLATKIERYLSDQNFARLMASAGQKYVIDNFNIKVITSQYEKEYLNLYEGFTNK